MAWKLVDEGGQEALPDQESSWMDYAKEGARHVGRTVSNIATRAIGTPGDILSLEHNLIADPIAQKLTGREPSRYEDTPLGRLIPTTEQHRKAVESQFGDVVKPESSRESFVDNVIEDAAMFFSPSKVAKSGVSAYQAGKHFIKSLGANVAGEAAEKLTESKQAGAWTKAGALLLGTLLDKEKSHQYVSKLYDQASSKLPSNATTKASSLEKSLLDLEHKVTKGRPASNLSKDEKFVLDEIEKFKQLIQNGEVNIEQLWAQKVSHNKEMSSLWQNFASGKEQKSIRNLAKPITSFVSDTMKQYGIKNPEFYKDFKNADEAFSVIAKSNSLESWMSRQPVTRFIVNAGLESIFGFAGKTAMNMAGAPALKPVYRGIMSPTLRSMYGKTLKAALQEDAPAFTKYAKEMVTLADKEREKALKGTWRLVE